MKPFKHQTDCHQNTCRNFTKDHSLFCPCTCSPQPTEDALQDPVAMSEFPEKEGWVEKFGELWDRSFDRDGNKNGFEYGELLLFISIQLAQAKEEERARIKKLIEEFKDRHDGEILTDVGESANFPAPNARKTCLVLLDKINE